MDMLKLYKCICCLVKCSKCLYFVKKAVCAVTIMLLIGSGLMCCCNKKMCKKLVSKIKAVM